MANLVLFHVFTAYECDDRVVQSIHALVRFRFPAPPRITDARCIVRVMLAAGFAREA